MKSLMITFAALVLLQSCEGTLSNMQSFPDWREGDSSGHGMIVLGSQLENPYSIENMTKALASVYPEVKSERVPVQPTDLYVRFLPEDETEFDALVQMGLNLLDHPVDFEIVEEGDWYHDPQIPEDDITWQYAVVKKDFDFPEGLRYEILEDCFIPENVPSTRSSGIDWAEVERAAYMISGNAGLLSAATRAGDGGVPSGTIAISDSRHGSTPEGVRGVMVSCNSFVKFANAYTDEDGHYTMDKSFASDPRYRIVFKNKAGFNIGMNLILVQASHSSLGRNPSSGISVTVTEESERKLFTRCAVNNAAYDYCRSCRSENESISLPPSNLRIWLFQRLESSSCPMLQQGALVDGSIVTDYLKEYASLLKMFLPDITIGLKGKNDYASIYAETVHEMAHASHFSLVGKEYWTKYIKYVLSSFVTSGFVTYGVGTEEDHGYCEVAEMWAYYTESSMYNERYPDEPRAFGTSWWFCPQVFMNLEEKGLGRHRIFAALTKDIYTRELLQKKLSSLYPEMKSAIKQAFGRYNL